MIKLVKYGASETKTATDFKREIANLDFSSFSAECYSSFEFCLKWKTVMYHKHSSRRLKTSKMSPPASPPEEVIRRRTRGRGRGPRAGGGAADAGEDGVRDLLDMINASDAAQQAVVMADTGLDLSDEDCASDSSRRTPGPPRKLRAAEQHPCAACLKLYQRVKRGKQKAKDKLLDNDPKSLTCDQWVLLKRWTPRRRPTNRVRRLRLHQLKFDKQADVTEEEEEEVWSCCRPHPFLHRNLRRVQMSLNRGKGKKNKMKRPRADSSGSRASKQQRFQVENDRQRISISISSAEDSPNSCQGTERQADASVGAEQIPSLKTPEPRQTLFEPRQKRGFRELLAQLRGSTIVREIQ